ncbi:MAG: hypothetical protein FWD78_04435 [Treponema sp.]|nr:hypothetical protein [Treponema sp.]
MEFSKEELLFITECLIKAKDQSETAGFDQEKIINDSHGSSDMKYYSNILNKIESELRFMGVPDRNNPAKQKE